MRTARGRLGTITVLAGASGLAFGWGCSGWFHAAARPEEGSRATAARAVALTPHGASPAAAPTSAACIPPLDGAVASPATAADEPPADPAAAALDATPDGGVPSPRAQGEARPTLTDELVRLRRLAERRVLGHALPVDSRPLFYEEPAAGEPPPNEAPVSPAPGGKTTASYRSPAFGHFVPVQNESALDHFHRALSRLAKGDDDDGKVRILAYGASHTEADVYTGFLRTYLQGRFGDGGQGFVLLGRVNRWYRTLDTSVRQRGLSIRHARYRLDVEDEPLGLFGAAFLGKDRDQFGQITTAADSPNTRFELQYLRQPRGGRLRVQIDGKTITVVDTRSANKAMGYAPFEATPGRHVIRVQPVGGGSVRLFGVVAETPSPGVVVDTLGIGGATLASQLTWDEELWSDAVHHRAPDLVTFAYGTNELADPRLCFTTYERHLRQVLERLRRALPEVSCVLISPFDVPEHRGGRWVSRQTLLDLIGVQRRVSEELGCGFWDGYAFMGGSGSMQRWVAAKPPLASPDHIHLTRLGYAYTGAAIGDALMRGFDSAGAQSPVAPAGRSETPDASAP